MKTKHFLLLIVLLFTTWQKNGLASVLIVTNTNDSGPGSLRNTIALAIDTDTIRFEPSLIGLGNDTIYLNTEIAFSKQLVIKGLYNDMDTLFLSGNNVARIFNITSTSNVTLDSLMFIQGMTSGDGGAVRFTSGSGLKIKNCLFSQNTAVGSGGALYTSGGGWIENSRFSENTSQTGDGGAIRCFHVSGSSLTLDIHNTTLDNNTTLDGDGGAIQTSFALNIYNSTIAENSSFLGKGGGIACQKSIYIDSSFIINNFAMNRGGGIYHPSQNASTFVCKNTAIDGNTSNNQGGGVCGFFNSFYVKNCEITNNNSGYQGGGFYCGYTYLGYFSFISDSTIFSDNNAGDDGGGIYSHMYGTMAILNSTFTNNSSGISGGAINFFPPYINSIPSWLHVTKSTFSGNTANANGAGIFLAISYDEISYVRLSTFTNNVSGQHGGGIYANLTTSVFFLENSTIYENSANNEGGGLYSENPIHMTGNIIAHNGANNIFAPFLTSSGYNLLSDPTLSGSISTDLLGIDSAALHLGVLSDNGGFTKTLMPIYPSTAINKGYPADTQDAQNKPINGIRDIGAAENFWGIDTHVVCNTNYTWTNGSTYTQSTTDPLDTIISTLGEDSIIVLDLTIIQLDLSVTINGVSLTSNETQANYQWLDCDDNFSHFIGDTNQTFSPLQDGSYAVLITNGLCTDTSTCYQITGVGLDKNTASQILISPNPCSGSVVIDFGNQEEKTLHVYNTSGQIVYTENILLEKTKQFSFEFLEKGIYIVEVRFSDRTERSKLLIQ
jgi:predicted outer membrane repeat protein